LLQDPATVLGHAHVEGPRDEDVGHAEHQQRQDEQQEVQQDVVEELVALVGPKFAALAVACERWRCITTGWAFPGSGAYSPGRLVGIN